MKKIDGKYVLSATDIKRADAHARAIARSAVYDGHVECWFDWGLGEFRWYEFTRDAYIRPEDHETIQFICSERCFRTRAR